MKEEALKTHLNGKIAISSKVNMNNEKDLALSYTPGVAYPCREIKNNPLDVYKYTSKGHMVLIVSDGSAVLGLGNIGAKAAIPVMEGKALLLKRFAGIDAFPICLDTQDPEEIIKTIKLISPSFGAINLEDISSPRCVEIERRLKSELDIPVFHDDQHGTAIVVGAALINACKLVNKELNTLKVVVSGTGAAGSAVIRFLYNLGVKEINAYNLDGVVSLDKYNKYDFVVKELLDEKIITTSDKVGLEQLLTGADVFIGVSAPGILTSKMVSKMNKDAIIFALANPIPEIMPALAKKAGARIVGTGRSDFPNQINNVLAFPGIFKGALKLRAPQITEDMKIAAAFALANFIDRNKLHEDNLIPSAFAKGVSNAISDAILKLG